MLVSQMSFCKDSSGGVTKSWLFSQATTGIVTLLLKRPSASYLEKWCFVESFHLGVPWRNIKLKALSSEPPESLNRKASFSSW